jgi:hypothetical protein
VLILNIECRSCTYLNVALRYNWDEVALLRWPVNLPCHKTIYKHVVPGQPVEQMARDHKGSLAVLGQLFLESLTEIGSMDDRILPILTSQQEDVTQKIV